MNITNLITLHPVIATAAIFWFSSNVIGTMPSPGSGGATDGLFYKWVFSLLHALIGSLPRLAATIAPGSIYSRVLGGGPGNGNGGGDAPIPPAPPPPATPSTDK